MSTISKRTDHQGWVWECEICKVKGEAPTREDARYRLKQHKAMLHPTAKPEADELEEVDVEA